MLVYIDLVSAPFDFLAFDNLPLSLATPSTYCDRLPSKIMRHSFGDKSCFANLSSLMAKLDKKNMLLIDSYDHLTAGLDPSALDLIEFFNTLPENHAVKINRDLLTQEQQQFLRQLKQTYLVLSVDRNAAGYSKDVHGQLNITQGEQPSQNIKFRVSENCVQVFNQL